jgi:hypothetical protein
MADTPTYKITHHISPEGMEMLKGVFAKPRQVGDELVWDILPDWLSILLTIKSGGA